MGKNKHKKNNPEGITSSVGGTFTPRKKKKGLGAMTPAREAVRKEIREIINHAKEEKDAIKRKVSHAAKSGIKGLKFKDDSSSTPKSNQASVVSSDTIRQVQKPKVVSSNEASYYDTWFYIIETELNNVKKKFK